MLIIQIKCTAFRPCIVSCGAEKRHLVQLCSGLIQRREQRSLWRGALSGAWCRIFMCGFLGSCTGIYPLYKQEIGIFIDLLQMCSQLKVTVVFVACVQLVCLSPCLTLALGLAIRAVNSPVSHTSVPVFSLLSAGISPVSRNVLIHFLVALGAVWITLKYIYFFLIMQS